MESNLSSNSAEPAEQINSNLDALRELGDSELSLGWSRQFAIILILVCAFVVIVWFGAMQKSSARPTLFNAGVVVEESLSSVAWIGLALEQAMIATIQSGEQVRVISPATNYSSFVLSPTSSSQSRAEWALHAVLRKGEPDSGTVVVQLGLFGTGQKTPTYRSEVIGSANSISDLATRAVEQVFSWLELDGLSQQQLGFARNEIPVTSASEAYGNGLIALAATDGRSALSYFAQANEIAPNNAAIHEGMANAWESLGYAENAAAESKLALDASGALTRRRQLELEAIYALRTEAWPRAQQVFAALKEFSPKELTYRLALAKTQVRQNDADGFQESILQMRSMQELGIDDPRIDLAEAAYWFDSGDYERCEELSRSAQASAEQSGDQHMLGEALLSIGRCDDTYDPTGLLQARDIFNALDTPLRESSILRELAKHEFGKGDMKQYLSYLEEALAVAQRLNNEPEIAASKNSLGQAYDMHGWLHRGYVIKTEVAEYQEQRNNKNRHSILLENIGISLFKLGRYDEAEKAIDQAGEIFVEIDDKIGIAWLPYRRGQIALRRGNIDVARQLMTQALKNAEERPEGNLAAEATFELGLINYFAGDYESAAATLRAANEVYRSQKMSASIAESEIALARLATQVSNDTVAQQHLMEADQYLSSEVAYYSMSLRSEQTLFGPAVSKSDQKRSCDRLSEITEGQEHMEYLLRAKTKIVACRGLLGGQAYTVSHLMLTAVEEQAKRLGLFDAQLAAGYTRAALLRDDNREQEAAVEIDRVQGFANKHNWVPHPIPGLTPR